MTRPRPADPAGQSPDSLSSRALARHIPRAFGGDIKFPGLQIHADYAAGGYTLNQETRQQATLTYLNGYYWRLNLQFPIRRGKGREGFAKQRGWQATPPIPFQGREERMQRGLGGKFDPINPMAWVRTRLTTYLPRYLPRYPVSQEVTTAT